jgi:hypothetical protein
MFLILPIGVSILKNIASFSISNFRPPGAKLSVSDFPFGLGATSVSLPNFSFLPHLKVGSFSRQINKIRFRPPFRNSHGKIFRISNFFPLWFGRSLCKSAKFQLSTSFRSGLAFVDNHVNFHIYWAHNLVPCHSGLRIVSSVLETPH